jgi:hypothetical protein
MEPTGVDPKSQAVKRSSNRERAAKSLQKFSRLITADWGPIASVISGVHHVQIQAVVVAILVIELISLFRGTHPVRIVVAAIVACRPGLGVDLLGVRWHFIVQ